MVEVRSISINILQIVPWTRLTGKAIAVSVGFLAIVECGATAFNKQDAVVTFHDATSVCKQGQRLPKFETLEDYEEFISFTSASSQGHHSYWLPIVRKRFPKWTWVNGSQTFYRPVEEADTMRCGLIDYTSPYLRTAACSSLWLGALCHRKGSVHCQDLHVGVKQLRIENTCVRVLMEKMNWYEARWRCQEAGMDLVIINTYQEERELKNKLMKHFKIFYLTHFWIGFRGSDWVYHDTGQVVKAVFWDRKEPRATNDCVVVHVKHEEHYWRTTDCNKKHRVICQDIPSLSRYHSTPETNS